MGYHFLAEARRPGITLHQDAQERTPAQSPDPHPTGTQTDPCADLHHVICSKIGETRDPTGVVRRDLDGELKALRIYEEIIRENPSWSSDQVDEALVQRIYTPQRVQRVRSAFEWVRASALKFIESQAEATFSPHEKKELKNRIRHLELQLPLPASLYSDEPDLFTKTGVFYERTLAGQTRIRVGGAYLFTATSWFNLLFTLAHEISHSIDPCELRAQEVSIPAYDRVTRCFVRTGLVAVRANPHECSDNDQTAETFADWLGVQLMSDAFQKYSTEFDARQLRHAITNSVRDLCESDEAFFEEDLSLHPSPKIRIDRIFGQNPKVREILGCQIPQPQPTADPNAAYCRFDKEN